MGFSQLLKRFYYTVYSYVLFGKYVHLFGSIRVSGKKNITIGNDCAINPTAFISARERIIIGDNVIISDGVKIIDAGLDPNNFINTKIPQYVSRPIIIENGVWIGASSIILKGVTIGKKSIVAAGSVVIKDVPEHVVVAGNPAKIIRTLQ